MSLRLDWCSHQAAKFAVEHWHYSKSLPGARKVYIGIWEANVFKGAIVYGLGSGSVTNGIRYGLKRSHEMAELCRIALTHHIAPVSQIIAQSVRMLKKQSPFLRLLISFADPQQGHFGVIYQAAGWLYTGRSAPDYQYYLHGRWRHHRSATSRAKSVVGLPSRRIPGKFRYLYPLDKEMRRRIQPLQRPYPKRPASIGSDAATFQAAEGGANPTAGLFLDVN